MNPIPQLQPFDEHNQALQAHAHPPDWVNPTPSGRYNLVVIGAGTAGLVAAAGAAGLGARVALIERELMGGDCLNVGCVPSKALIRAARAAAAVRDAGQFGVAVHSSQADFAAAMQRMRRLRAVISPHDSAARFRDLGVDVYLGQGRFVARDAIEVDGRQLLFSKAMIATGARAAEPPVEGLPQAGYLTNETVFSLTELPGRLAVIGGGPIGAEMAQTFARFGSQVTLIEKAAHILPREDRDAAQRVQAALQRDGVQLLLQSQVQTVTRDGGERLLTVRPVDSAGGPAEIRVDEILVAVGRAPNVEQLQLEAAEVAYDARAGVQVDDRLRTSNRRVFAAGDVCSAFKFTHAADFMARIVLQNALFPLGRARASRLVIPWCTYTSPELAHVGISQRQAEQQGIAVDTFRLEFDHVDRAILDGETDGLVMVHLKRGTDKILGATIVAGHAGEMISELALAMTHGLGLKQIGSTIHPYPTQADAIRKLGDLYNRTRLKPWIQSLLGKWFAWTR